MLRLTSMLREDRHAPPFGCRMVPKYTCIIYSKLTSAVFPSTCPVASSLNAAHHGLQPHPSWPQFTTVQLSHGHLAYIYHSSDGLLLPIERPSAHTCIAMADERTPLLTDIDVNGNHLDVVHGAEPSTASTLINTNSILPTLPNNTIISKRNWVPDPLSEREASRPRVLILCFDGTGDEFDDDVSLLSFAH